MGDDPRVGTELAGYRILEVIGSGGASVVYLAVHSRLGRNAALKVLTSPLAHDSAFRERFVRESQIAAGLDHPNIVPVYDAGEADGVLYLAMRYIKGSDLGHTVRSEGPLDPWRVIAIISDVASALDTAHAEGLVHRDVKPGNILLTRDRTTGIERAFLADFGLTKRLASSGGGLTHSGQFVGTVDYVAPEQILGEPVDGRADGYSLACVLFLALTGKPPFPRPNDVGTIYAHVHEPPPHLTANGTTKLDRVIARGLAKDRNDRYGTCSSLVEATRSALQAEPETLAGDLRRSGPTLSPKGFLQPKNLRRSWWTGNRPRRHPRRGPRGLDMLAGRRALRSRVSPCYSSSSSGCRTPALEQPGRGPAAAHPDRPRLEPGPSNSRSSRRSNTHGRTSDHSKANSRTSMSRKW